MPKGLVTRLFTRFENPTFFQDIYKRLSDLWICLVYQWWFGYENILACFEMVNLGDKVCSEESFGSIAFDSIAYLFAGNKTDSAIRGFFVKEDKPRRMPSPIRFAIDRIERFGIANTVKLFYTANLFLPFALLALMTFLPFFVFILVLKPCVLFLGVL
jgi:hypothetical protein